jgi:hypothetical protein
MRHVGLPDGHEEATNLQNLAEGGLLLLSSQKMSFLVLLLIIGSAVLLGFLIYLAFIRDDSSGSADPSVYGPHLRFPYVASQEREKQIREGAKKITVGMTEAEVKRILGEPDIIRPLFEPKVIKANRIGTTYWYLVEQEQNTDYENSKIVRIALDLNGNVTDIVAWGLRQK